MKSDTGAVTAGQMPYGLGQCPLPRLPQLSHATPSPRPQMPQYSMPPGQYAGPC